LNYVVEGQAASGSGCTAEHVSGAGRKLSERERSAALTKLAGQISLKDDTILKTS